MGFVIQAAAGKAEVRAVVLDPGAAAALLAAVEAYPNLRRVAPAFARQTGEEVFELGIGIILDGLAVRVP